jgi:hypothetical protein
MTPKERAIEKLADIIWLNNGHKTPNETAAEILDALNIEIVSKETKPNIEDFFRMRKNSLSPQNEQPQCYHSDLNYPKGTTFYIDIRNNKPAIYVENIGVKNEQHP